MLEGEIEATVLPEDPAEPGMQVTLRSGSVFVVPRGLWHRQEPKPSVSLLFLTAAETTEHSMAVEPRSRES